jgi:MYXO-CTERM domain-containing protein
MRIRSLLAATAVAMLWSTWAMAGVEPLIVVDEYGHGSFLGQPLSWRIAPDPTQGVAGNVLIYDLPFTVTPGDVLLQEPIQTAYILSDIIRFTNITDESGDPRAGMLIFYSDGSDGLDAPADVRSLPSPLANHVQIAEQGPEGNNYADYFPSANEPGSNTDGTSSYRFISDSPAVPLPGAAWMGMALLGGLAALRRRAA